MTSLENGQELWWVTEGSKRAYVVIVSKVGRKWAQLDNGHRIDVDTLVADGGEYTSPGRCYLNRELYEQESAVLSEWKRLKDDMHSQPKNLSVDDILAARKLLGL